MRTGTDGTMLFENFIELLSVEDLAGLFGLAPKTIRNWVARREIPFVTVGRKTMFRLRSIEAWLDRKEHKPWLS
jgi:excisionase family DNA binding protein